MTTLPWMKDCSEALTSTPIEPLNEHDKRPLVADLINEHKENIHKIRDGIADHALYDPIKHDDLWILRFWLSHKNLAPAIKAAYTTLAFRDKYNLDHTDIRDVPPQKLTEGAYHRYKQYSTDDSLHMTIPDKQGCVVTFFRLEGFDKNEMVKNVTEDDWLLAFMYCSEWGHQWVDYVTRTTGRLTKSTRLINLEGLSLASANREGIKRDSNAMEIMEDCYPQMLATIYICNAPALFQVLWRICRPLIPTRVVSKIDVINPANNEQECERLLEYISEDNLPAVFGGKNSVPYTEM